MITKHIFFDNGGFVRCDVLPLKMQLQTGIVKTEDMNMPGNATPAVILTLIDNHQLSLEIPVR